MKVLTLLALLSTSVYAQGWIPGDPSQATPEQITNISNGYCQDYEQKMSGTGSSETSDPAWTGGRFYTCYALKVANAKLKECQGNTTGDSPKTNENQIKQLKMSNTQGMQPTNPKMANPVQQVK